MKSFCPVYQHRKSKPRPLFRAGMNLAPSTSRLAPTTTFKGVKANMSIMLPTNTVAMKPIKAQQRILKTLLVRTSALWNVEKYQRQQAFFDENQASPSYTEQYHNLKHQELYQELGSVYSQQILRKLDKSWPFFWGSLKLDQVNHMVSIPGCFKNYKRTKRYSAINLALNERITDILASV